MISLGGKCVTAFQGGWLGHDPGVLWGRKAGCHQRMLGAPRASSTCKKRKMLKCVAFRCVKAPTWPLRAQHRAWPASPMQVHVGEEHLHWNLHVLVGQGSSFTSQGLLQGLVGKKRLVRVSHPLQKSSCAFISLMSQSLLVTSTGQKAPWLNEFKALAWNISQLGRGFLPEPLLPQARTSFWVSCAALLHTPKLSGLQ